MSLLGDQVAEVPVIEDAPDDVVEGIEANLRAAGQPTETHTQVSYFGFEERHQCFLPDGKSFIEHTTLNEGARRKYLNKINREVAIKRASGDAVMKMASGDEKHALLEEAIVGWNLLGPDGNPITFVKGSPGSTLSQFLNVADPRIVDIIEKDIRKHNPWLMADMTSEDIKKQMEDLEEMLQVKLREEEGKAF